ncbi:MAG TPA: HAMP domain-containing sensor histidine kinase [Thermoanaerobaculia bacterium]|nr:HAMP domain-containing sensor histidine kinase [Thermoanaerobaculia bacterium]
MARKCFMCGHEITEGILCEKCDKPRKKSSPAAAAPEPPAPPPARAKPDSGRHGSSAAAAQHQVEEDPFPKAPVLTFPIESASPAVTSVVNLLVAAGAASILLGPDRSVKFVSDEARRLFDATQSELNSLSVVESKAGIRVGDLSLPTTTGVRIGTRNFIYTLVPMSGGASGAVIVFRQADPMNEAHISFAAYVRETVLSPLRALRDSLRAAAQSRNDHFLADTSNGIEQILSSMEMAPDVEEHSFSARPVPTVTDVVRRVADRFRAHGDLKGIRLDVDVQELDERFANHEQLADALAILMENAVHYVPAGGQVVIGVRWMEHKGKPLLLFFVMDNGPVVPEPLRQSIFEPSFVWNPIASDRTGRGLFKCREFAVAHAGSIWVESKTGKACTFFLRVRPDGVR